MLEKDTRRRFLSSMFPHTGNCSVYICIKYTYSYMSRYTHTHACTHTYTQTYHTLTLIHTHSRTHRHSCTHTHMHTCMRTLANMSLHLPRKVKFGPSQRLFHMVNLSSLAFHNVQPKGQLYS